MFHAVGSLLFWLYPHHKPEQKQGRLDICPADFYARGKFKSYAIGDFIEEQLNHYEEIYFHNFNFSDQNLFLEIINRNSEKIFFTNVSLTKKDLLILIEREMNISRWSYHINDNTFSFQEYSELFHMAYPDNLKSLKGIKVIFENTDISNLNDEILIYCQLLTVKNIVVSENQLVKLLTHSDSSIDLTEFTIENMDFSYIIREFSHKIFINSYTNMNNIIVDLASLAFCIKEEKFLRFFESKNFSVKMLDTIIENVNIHFFLERFEKQHNKGSFFCTKTSALIYLELEGILSKKGIVFSKALTEKSSVEKCLWAFYCMHHFPSEKISLFFAKALGFNQKFQMFVGNHVKPHALSW